jgi:hypothetical protein
LGPCRRCAATGAKPDWLSRSTGRSKVRHGRNSISLAITALVISAGLAGCASPGESPDALAERAWPAVDRLGTLDALSGFIARYPNSPRAAEASARILSLSEHAEYQTAASAGTQASSCMHHCQGALKYRQLNSTRRHRTEEVGDDLIAPCKFVSGADALDARGTRSRAAWTHVRNDVHCFLYSHQIDVGFDRANPITASKCVSLRVKRRAPRGRYFARAVARELGFRSTVAAPRSRLELVKLRQLGLVLTLLGDQNRSCQLSCDASPTQRPVQQGREVCFLDPQGTRSRRGQHDNLQGGHRARTRHCRNTSEGGWLRLGALLWRHAA